MRAAAVAYGLDRTDPNVRGRWPNITGCVINGPAAAALADGLDRTASNVIAVQGADQIAGLDEPTATAFAYGLDRTDSNVIAVRDCVATRILVEKISGQSVRSATLHGDGRPCLTLLRSRPSQASRHLCGVADHRISSTMNPLARLYRCAVSR